MDILVKKAQRGDKEAFVKLMEKEKQSMYKVAKSILKKDEDAADAIQETILSCYEHLNQLRKTSYFKTWMTRILINNCNMIWRKRQETVSMELCGDIEGPHKDSDSEFMEMLSRLEDKYRIILVLFYVEGFSIKEIGQILEMNENTVKTRLSRGRDRFRNIYEDECPGTCRTRNV